MKYFLISLFLIFSSVFANILQAEEEKEPQTFVFTDYTDDTELFVEFSALIVGETSSFAAHFSKMSDFLPAEKGMVTVTLTGGNQPEETFSVDGVSVPGIFIPKATPRYAGQRQLTIALKSPQLNGSHHLGEITVYPDIKTAIAAAPEEEEDGDISFLKEQQWKVEFATERVIERSLQASIPAFGSLKAAAANQAYSTAPVNGHVLTASQVLPQVGMTVKKGQLLVSLAAKMTATTDLAELKMNLQSAKARYQLASEELSRLKTLLKEQIIVKARLNEARSNFQIAKAELQASEKRLQQIKQKSFDKTSGVNVYAPIDGMITAVHIASGSYVQEGNKLFHIVNQKNLWLEAKIAEADMPRLKQPTRIGFKSAGFNDEFQLELGKNASLIAYGKLIDPISRTLPIVFEFDNQAYQLPVGALVQARIYDGKKLATLAIPEAALIDDNGQDVVFVHSAGESFQRRIVRLGIRDNGYVQVISGVEKGERVVTKGAYLVYLASMSTQTPAHGHAH